MAVDHHPVDQGAKQQRRYERRRRQHHPYGNQGGDRSAQPAHLAPDGAEELPPRPHGFGQPRHGTGPPAP